LLARVRPGFVGSITADMTSFFFPTTAFEGGMETPISLLTLRSGCGGAGGGAGAGGWGGGGGGFKARSRSASSSSRSLI